MEFRGGGLSKLISTLSPIKQLLSHCERGALGRRSAAFTLAEVLITLGIIGVVAAITLPILITNHQKQAYVSGLKKAYSSISNAFNLLAQEEGVSELKQTSCANIGFWSCASGGNNYNNLEPCSTNIVKQFNVVEKDTDIRGSDTYYNDNPFLSIITADGMKYTFRSGETGWYADGEWGVEVLGLTSVSVDVNGDKGPNKVGRDIFLFYLKYSNNKIVPAGAKDSSGYDVSYCMRNGANTSDTYNYSCTAKVLLEGKMNY